MINLMEVRLGSQGELIPLLAPDKGSRLSSILSTSTNLSYKVHREPQRGPRDPSLIFM